LLLEGNIKKYAFQGCQLPELGPIYGPFPNPPKKFSFSKFTGKNTLT
jgi:hypothetical protein